MPAVRMRGQEEVLRRHHPQKHRWGRFEGKNPWWRYAVAGIAIKTLPLRGKVVGGDRAVGSQGQVRRVPPDASQQQKHHGQANQQPARRGDTVISQHESWDANEVHEQLVSFYTNSDRVTNITDV